MLVERALRSIGSLTSLHRTSVMPFDLIRRSSESFSPIFITFLTLLDFLPFFLKFAELGGELIPLVDEFPHLGHEHNIGEMQPAVLVVIVEIGIIFSIALQHLPLYSK